MSEIFYQEQTRLAVDNFSISGSGMPAGFIHALGALKLACAKANLELGELDKGKANAIIQVGEAIAAGNLDNQFPVDVYQTGSGTSTNMNANEVIATLASKQSGLSVHPNDDVNMGQSSNDVIPSTIHIASMVMLKQQMMPALQQIEADLDDRIDELSATVKTGRTHLMDAMPVTFGQELSGWQAQLRLCRQRIEDTCVRLCRLAIGGTAVGTGINTQSNFGALTCKYLSEFLDLPFTVTDNHFAAISSQDTALELSGQLNTLAAALMKISNDLRWMNSGPLAGLGEITLPKLQAGSSIMPGKVNPVIPEAVAMACAQTMGYHSAITVAAQSGNFQLNVMLPLIGQNLLLSQQLLTRSCEHLTRQVITRFTVNKELVEQALNKNPILVTALNQRIGYEKGTEIAKKAYEEKRDILDVAKAMTNIDEEELRSLLDPARLV